MFYLKIIGFTKIPIEEIYFFVVACDKLSFVFQVVDSKPFYLIFKKIVVETIFVVFKLNLFKIFQFLFFKIVDL